MRIKALLALLILTVSANAQETVQQNIKDLMGSWTIDLRPSPEADGYFQPMIISTVENNKLSGTFYGSEISEGFVNTNWNRIYFAFTTSDNTHSYYHSGYLQNGRLFGISYCPGREFTAPWNGVKIKRDEPRDR